jgi:hypothetical protein
LISINAPAAKAARCMAIKSMKHGRQDGTPAIAKAAMA